MHLAQKGKKHEQAKPLKGFGGAGVLEVVEDFKSDTYRAVYTSVLAMPFMFCIASRRNRRTALKLPKPDMNLIRERLKAAEAHAKGTGK